MENGALTAAQHGWFTAGDIAGGGRGRVVACAPEIEALRCCMTAVLVIAAGGG